MPLRRISVLSHYRRSLEANLGGVILLDVPFDCEAGDAAHRLNSVDPISLGPAQRRCHRSTPPSFNSSHSFNEPVVPTSTMSPRYGGGVDVQPLYLLRSLRNTWICSRCFGEFFRWLVGRLRSHFWWMGWPTSGHTRRNFSYLPGKLMVIHAYALSTYLFAPLTSLFFLQGFHERVMNAQRLACEIQHIHQTTVPKDVLEQLHLL